MELNAVTILGVLGALVFAVNVVVEVFKKILPDKIPTDIIVFILSITLTEAALLIYNVHTVRAGTWYEYVLAIFGGFVVAYIAMFGWSKLKELWDRSKSDGK